MSLTKQPEKSCGRGQGAAVSAVTLRSLERDLNTIIFRCQRLSGDLLLLRTDAASARNAIVDILHAKPRQSPKQSGSRKSVLE